MHEELVLIASYLWPFDVHLDKSRLEADGITCFVFNEELISMNWLYSAAVGGVKLYVRADDLQRAQEILGAQCDGTVLESGNDERCPACQSLNLEYKNDHKRWIFLSWLLIGIPLPFFKERWKCKDCGYVWDEESMS